MLHLIGLLAILWGIDGGHGCMLTRLAKPDTLIIQQQQSDANMTVLIQTKHSASCTARCCLLEYPFLNETNLHVYVSYQTQPLSFCHATQYSQLNTTTAQAARDCLTIAWHTPAKPAVYVDLTVENTIVAQAYQNLSINQKKPIVNTVETIIQSASHLRLKDLCQNATSPRPVSCDVNVVYHSTPTVANGQPEYYCFYRKRQGQAGLVPDCANITANVQWIVQLFNSMGVDAIVTDTTNLYQYPDDRSDIWNIRPFEVLAEELSAIRASGTPTPSLAAWTTAGNGTTMYKGMLPVYFTYPDLLVRNAKGHPIYFIDGHGNRHPPDDDVIRAIESQDNITTLQTWGSLSRDSASKGEWSYQQPCATPQGNFTTTILNNASYLCRHLITPKGPLGSAMSLTFSWQADYSSLPFATPAKMMGLTFQAQFDDALRSKPDNLLLPSFNELNSFGIVPNPGWRSSFGSVGLHPEDQSTLFVDIYAAERGRTWGPTVEAGDFYTRLAASCLRVATLLWSSNVTACTVANELCCNRSYAVYNRVVSLRTPDNSAFRTTTSLVTTKAAYQQGWIQTCVTAVSYYSTDYFCYHPGMLNSTARQGPFLLYAQGQVPPESHAGHLDRLARVPVWSCPDTGNSLGNASYHVTATPCSDEGGELLGYGASRPSSAMPRILRRCIGVDGVSHHTTDWPCASGMKEEHVAYVF
eukprot:m.93893 g.93893  ORF g.93893 m.93893 type:complete len:697 (-) comp14995_c0_seq1:104-2194(-)